MSILPGAPLGTTSFCSYQQRDLQLLGLFKWDGLAEDVMKNWIPKPSSLISATPPDPDTDAYNSIHPPVLTVQLHALGLKKSRIFHKQNLSSFNSPLRWKEKQITGRGKKKRLLETTLEQCLAPVLPDP